jgi:hypothetical protein
MYLYAEVVWFKKELLNTISVHMLVCPSEIDTAVWYNASHKVQYNSFFFFEHWLGPEGPRTSID